MNKKGSILMITLWILAILVIFSLGLGHRAAINLRLARYQRDRLKATYLAKAGINRAILELEKDENDYDSLGEVWSSGVDSNNNHLFENIEIKEGDGTFTVKYRYDKDTYLCMADEERKININRIDDFGQKQLSALLLFVGLVEPEIDELKNIIIDWIDTGLETEPGKGIFKNEPLKKPEELLVVLEYFYQKEGRVDYKEKAREVYNKVKDLITVYGEEKKLNINTTSENILTIFLKSVAEGDERNCAASVVGKIIEVRKAQPKEAFENMNNINISTESGSCEEALFNRLKGNINDYFILKSNNSRIESTGNVGPTNRKISKKIITIYDRQNKKIVSWHEN